MKIAWKDEYDLGIESIDLQHRMLIGIINSLTEAIERNDPAYGVAQAIDEMRAYAEEHLAYEEKLFDQCAFAEADAHREEHDVFRETLGEFRARAETTGPIVAIELLGYLEAWLLKHILVTDRKYVEAFKTSGIK